MVAAVYPLSTRHGDPIPLDIINPEGFVYQTFTADAASSIVIPAGYVIGAFQASVPCLVRFGATLPIPVVAGTIYPNTLLVPVGIIVTAAITPSTLYILGLQAGGTLMIQLIEKWADIGLAQQYSKK